MKEIKAIYKPYDKSFKQSLSNIAVAKDFLTTHIPAKTLDKFNLNNIEICKESYIDEEVQEQLTDVVYKMRINSSSESYN